MKPLVIGAAVGGVVLVAGAVALLPKEEPIEVPAPVVATPRPAPRPEPVFEPVMEQANWNGQDRGGPFGDIIRAYTTEFDRDGDGALNEEERREAWAAFEKKMLEQWDKDGDGVLSPEERRAGMEAMMRERTEAEMARRFDRDGDGELSDSERAEMEAMRAEREARRQQFELQQYDLDKDGVITAEERNQVDTKRREQREQFQSMVTQRFDADGDGQMSRLEWQSAGQQMRQDMRDLRTARAVDADGNGIADAADLSAWAQKIAAGDMSADLNRDGMLDQRDLQWANDAVQTASTRRIDPVWEAMMAEMGGQGGRGMQFMAGGPGGGDRVQVEIVRPGDGRRGGGGGGGDGQRGGQPAQRSAPSGPR